MENYQVKVYERTGKNQKTIHIINMPDEHPRGGWYRQIVSLGAFKHRALHRWFNYWRTKHYKSNPKAMVRFHDWDGIDDRIWEEACETLNLDKPTHIHITHESLWDFYDYIGYNHKDKSVKQIDSILIVGLNK